MQLKIMNNDIEFELSRNTKNTDVILGINIKDINSEFVDIMTISICLHKDELKDLRELIK